MKLPLDCEIIFSHNCADGVSICDFNLKVFLLFYSLFQKTGKLTMESGKSLTKLFINSKITEINDLKERMQNLQLEDRPDILVRTFKMKLENLIFDIRNKNFFGPSAALIYTIEF
ncbi:unnamed protein product [Microthlaspi erraticum]|nr:unnamed protein product [Microthlaspi erraticum]